MIRYDMAQGIWKNIGWFLPVVYFTFAFFAKTRQMLALPFAPPVDKMGLTDLVFSFFSGMETYHPGPGQMFDPPIQWLLVFFYLSFLISFYPAADMKKYGRNLMIHVKSREVYWYSKCLWVFATTMVYYGLILLLMAIFLLMTGNYSPGFHKDTGAFLAGVIVGPETGAEICFFILVTPFLVMLSLALLQNLLSFVLSPVYGFLVNIGLVICSAFFNTSLCVGQIAMFKRSFISGGSVGWPHLVIPILLSVLSILAGGMYFKRKDIL